MTRAPDPGLPAFRSALARTAQTVEGALEKLLPLPPDSQGDRGEAALARAMRYAALGNGKRLRAFLALQSASLFGVETGRAARLAAAVESVHAYSLVHDDLPAMDDDSTRRGRPSTHMAFGEAMAILAGDALQARAFEILADDDTHEDPFVRCELLTCLAQAIGAEGMAGGQARDISPPREAGVDPMLFVTRTQRLKTGALIEFSCLGGAIMGKAAERPRRALSFYAHDLGLAFQIRDDLLDAKENSASHRDGGSGSKSESERASFVSVLGEEAAREHAHRLSRQAIAHLEIFAAAADPLRHAALFAVARSC